MPDLVAVVVEDEASVLRRREPKVLGELAFELARRPAGIAERDETLGRAALVADVAQDLAARCHGEAGVDVDRIRATIISTVHHKADVGLDGTAGKNAHRAGGRRILLAER